jgi:hypothetical protein
MCDQKRASVSELEQGGGGGEDRLIKILFRQAKSLSHSSELSKELAPRGARRKTSLQISSD